ncbi:MAG TPA: hypothetical protein VNA17_07670, partial [Pyrinomonadaceae bacterium]|nr:hypothetical protein [Pyrinomonadaceae bacterium]
MSRNQSPFRFAAVRFATVAIIGGLFFTVASFGTSAASMSFMDSLGEFLGLQAKAGKGSAPLDPAASLLVEN